MGTDARAREVRRLSECADPLSGAYDLAILDLDGVVYRGDDPVPRAPEALRLARAEGMRLAYITNNASRTPETVVERLRRLGAPVEDGDVVTSAQAAARMVSSMVPSGSRVLLVGGAGLEAALAEYGLTVVRRLDEEPAAVVQGFDSAIGWEMLAEASYAVAAGLPWVASNMDLTLPAARGIAPGNGTLVAAVASATGASPVVAGKPEPPLFDETVRRVGGQRPLMVGDRLDTDIAGANAVGVDSLLVLTGVSTLREVANVAPGHRPTYLGLDLDALHEPQPPVRDGATGCACEGVTVTCENGRLVAVREGSSRSGDATALLRAAVATAWMTREKEGDVDVDTDAVHQLLETMVG